MNVSKRLEKKPVLDTTPRSKGERSFDLSLQTLVSGTDSAGKDFSETTGHCFINCQAAIFGLNSKVTIGSKLNLLLDIPKTLLLENHLILHVSGDVVRVKAETNNSKSQTISLQLNKSYKIQSSS